MRSGPEGRTNKVRSIVCELLKILFDFLLFGSPREIGVGLVKANRTQGTHHCGAGESLGKENNFRMTSMDFFQEAFPERNGFCMRIIDTEDRHPVGNPQFEHVTNRCVDSFWISIEVQGIDVLIFLRWVFCVGDRAICSLGEPFRMLADPRVVGGTLKCDIQCNL